MDVQRYLKTFFSSPRGAIASFRLLEERACAYDEIFVRQDYYWLWSRMRKGTVVLDLGANIGDTLIYFAMHSNVAKVLGYEAQGITYNAAARYVSMLPQPLRDKITLYNAAVACAHGITKYSNTHVGDRGFRVGAGHKTVKTTTLDSAIHAANEYSTSIAIKCDIEGYEYKVFKEAAKLSKVYMTMIEYHDGPQDLPRILRRNGFNVRTEKRGITSAGGEQGFIYAVQHK